MEIQKLGSIETEKQTLRAMLLVDSDKPNEWMIHCWSNEPSEKFAILFDATNDGGMHYLSPRWLYRAGESNNLFLPAIRTAEEDALISNLQVILRDENSGLSGTWEKKTGGSGKVTFDFSPPEGSHVNAVLCNSWDEFKSWARTMRLQQDAAMFRGHGCSKFSLRTSLHRTGRRRIERYVANELRQFCNHAEAVLNKRFNLDDSWDYSTVLGLAQHHGLPTPLMDWTASPYIAAFFAFSDSLEFQSLRHDSTHVRIYAITQNFVNSASPNFVNLVQTHPFVAALDVPPRHNTRLYAQQGKFLVTNVANVENFFKFLEDECSQTILFAADVPISVAAEALEDLTYMGLTAATLFPGMDGVGRMIRHSMLFKRPSFPSLSKQG